MAEYLIQDSTLTAIADAIREKSGASDPIAVPDMAAQISAITTGSGGDLNVEVCYITFMSHDGATELYKKPVVVGDSSCDPVTKGLMDTPTRESSVQYDYTFAGWSTTADGSVVSSALNTVTADRTLYAVYNSSVRSYTISFYDEDGTLLATQSVAYGETPEYVPRKDGYVFNTWTPSLTAVTGDASYTASWVETGGGSCGDYLQWFFDADTGVLTISGTGAMDNYGSVSDQPWYDVKDAVTSLVIEEGVTTIGHRAFLKATALASISLPSTLVSIGISALAQTVITALVIPENCTEIGSSALSDNKLLTTVTLPDGITVINGIFPGCYVLNNVVIPASVVKITPYTFNACYGLTSVTFQNTSGWWYSDDYQATSGTTLSATNLASTSTAAKYLSSTYLKYYWFRT